MKKIRLTRQARQDLDDIWFHIAQDSVDSAHRFLEFLTDKFTLLASSPRMGRRRDEFQEGLRSLPVKSYLIFYRPLGKTGISIVRVVSGYRELGPLFDDQRP